MSGNQGAFNHLVHGEPLTAGHDVYVWLRNRFLSLPTWAQNFFAKEGDDELTILKGLIPVAMKDIVSGGFSTDAFVQAGKDVLAQLVAQNVTTFTMQEVMAHINMAVASDPDAQAVLVAAKGVLGIASITVPGDTTVAAVTTDDAGQTA